MIEIPLITFLLYDEILIRRGVSAMSLMVNSRYDIYAMYHETQNQTSKAIDETKNQPKRFNLQEILNSFGNYTYTKEDKDAVDEHLVKQLKEKLELKEEDVYELYKRGVDLEGLSIYELKEKSDTQDKEENENPKKKNTEYKLNKIQQKPDEMYLNTLTKNSPITMNTLYENCFKGNFKKGGTNYTKEDVDNVLTQNGLATNDNNRWAANMLMMYDMGVSPSKVQRLTQVDAAVEMLGIDTDGDEELVKDDMVQYEPEYVERITDELGMVTDEYIEKLFEEGREINIKELRQQPISYYQNQRERNYQVSPENQFNVDEVKRQILEITQKLTTEAAQKISEKMPLESSRLQEVANALGEMQQEMATQALKNVYAPVTQENIEIVMTSMQVVQEMKYHFNQTIQIEVATDEKATLSEMHHALSRYMANETPVEARFGENIKKVENQIERLLENQGIEATQTNIEAAKALITNHIDVSEEQIQNIENIVLKVDTFLEEMTPTAVATMLKEGINPYQSTVNELLIWTENHQVEGLKTSVAEAIITLEDQGQISKEQKDGMIGIYQILQSVERQKEEVMGYLYRNNLPMTVENLAVAARYATGKRHIQHTVDDSLKETTIVTNTASDKIEKTVETSQKTQEILRTLEEMSLPITEENINRATKMNALLYPYIKEQFKQQLGSFDGMNTLPKSFLDKLEVAQNASSELLENMIQQEIPLTLSNIYWATKMMNEPEIYGSLLNDKGLLKEDLPKDLESFEEELKELEQTAKDNTETATLKRDWQTYKSYKQINELVSFERQRIEKEGIYQIPFIIDGERRLVNLYVQDNKESNTIQDPSHLKAMITYQTKTLGEVKISLEIQNDRIGYKVESEKEGTDRLQAQVNDLAKALEAIGYHVGFNQIIENEEAEQNSQPQAIYSTSLFEETV